MTPDVASNPPPVPCRVLPAAYQTACVLPYPAALPPTPQLSQLQAQGYVAAETEEAASHLDARLVELGERLHLATLTAEEKALEVEQVG